MLEQVLQINLLAVAGATTASFLLGGVWFLLLFPRKYLVIMGREKEPIQKPSLLFIIGPLACSFITILTISLVMQSMKLESLSEALVFASVVSIGIVIPTCMTIAINPNFPHPLKYTVLNAPYFFLSNVMSAAILFSLR